MRITKVTTKKGDKGKTDLGNGTRISKNHPRIHTIGEIDELNAFLGFAITKTTDNSCISDLKSIQNDLFNLGGELALPDSDLNLLSDDRINFLEKHIEKMNSELPPLKEFILPGGDEFSSRLGLARAVCRRAERTLVGLLETEKGRELWIVYLNRLSDYLFVLARYYTHQSGGGETQWVKRNGWVL
ncbi:MAG: cob(I)yrinic acid a,c-diamide adenosyltransferase [Candidatus Marinimicrobia bacterium]|nr:cob(I)yrinic acid a,c-diamide adenosyltransferase [Candidatus Neomarinimicrobiota bacterium]